MLCAGWVGEIDPGVDITNMFTPSFYAHRSQKRKMANNLTVIFALLGSTSVKAACKTLMKLTLGAADCESF